MKSILNKARHVECAAGWIRIFAEDAGASMDELIKLNKALNNIVAAAWDAAINALEGKDYDTSWSKIAIHIARTEELNRARADFERAVSDLVDALDNFPGGRKL